MDINDLRSLFTVMTFVIFVAIVFWAWSGRRRDAFHEAAQLPLDDEMPTHATSSRDHSKHN